MNYKQKTIILNCCQSLSEAIDMPESQEKHIKIMAVISILQDMVESENENK